MTLANYKKALIAEGIDAAKIKAITTVDGPLLIIAGPGSGKTKTLVERVVFLVQMKKVSPSSILVATFTEKAARELITRVSDRLLALNIKVDISEMYIGTLHSIFTRFVEENHEYTRLRKNHGFLDAFDQAYVVYSHFKKFDDVENLELLVGKRTNSDWWQTQELIKQLSKVSEEYLDPAVLKKSKHPAVKALGKAYEIYRSILEEENVLDFAAMQTDALDLLNNHPKVLAALQQKIKYLMIDEYQDTNTIQDMILMKLAAKHKNICVVGDDDQGLYRFRGATVRNILEFPKKFPKGKCQSVKLVTNYRSHPGIIEFYNNWMTELNWKEGKKEFRFDKTVKPRKDKFGKYPAVLKVSSSFGEADYHEEVLNFIRELERKKILQDHNQIAFLFRSVASEQVLSLAHFLENNGINVFSPRSALFFQRKEIKMAIGCFVTIFPKLFDWLKWNDQAFLPIWEFYHHCKAVFNMELDTEKELHKGLAKWCREKAREHEEIGSNKDYAFAALFYQMLQFPLFAQPLDVKLTEQKHDLRAGYNLSLLSQLLTKYETLAGLNIFTKDNHLWMIKKFFNQYLRFLYDGGMGEYEKFDEYAPSGSVSFMTIHQAKGLEFPIVFVGSLNAVPRKQYTDLDIILQNEYYHKKPFEPFERLKEFDFWRVFYTAFSRPQNLLVLTAHEKEGRGANPSKYLKNIYSTLLNWDDDSFDLKHLKLDKVRKIHIKKKYSFTSHITVFENCPLQYKFYKDMEFSPVRTAATLFGQLVHQTIEDIHKAAVRGEQSSIKEKNIEKWFETNYQSLSKSRKTYLGAPQKMAALHQVLEYVKRHQDKWENIREAEVELSLVKDEYILNGKIDLIHGADGTVEIIDFKGEKKPDINHPQVHEKMRRYQRQLEVYSHLVEERTGEKVSKMHLYYTGEAEGDPYVSFNYEQQKVKSTIREFDTVVAKIEQKDFDMSHIERTDQLCRNCDMRYYCNHRKKTA